MSPARRIVAVVSGKGGVGKSTVSLNLALALAERGVAVGLLDADIYGPDLALMVGLTRRERAKSVAVWNNPALKSQRSEPVERLGIKLMSAQFLIAEDQTIAMSTPMMELFMNRLVEGIDWGPLDYLIIDLPPGTADLQQLVARRLELDGIIVVVTPQDLAHLDAKKAIAMYAAAGVDVLGGVENMAGLECPDCGHHIEVFPAVAPDRSIWKIGVPRLARIPLAPAVAAAAEWGRPALVADPDGEPAAAFRTLAAEVLARLVLDQPA